jgi:hypothetical protein
MGSVVDRVRHVGVRAERRGECRLASGHDLPTEEAMNNALIGLIAGVVLSGLLFLRAVGDAPKQLPAIDGKPSVEEVLPGAYVFGGGKFVVKWIGFGDAAEIVVGMKGSSEPAVHITATKSGLRVSNAAKLGQPIGLAP